MTYKTEIIDKKNISEHFLVKNLNRYSGTGTGTQVLVPVRYLSFLFDTKILFTRYNIGEKSKLEL